MKTTHKINFSSSSDLSMLNDNSIHLVCTSCPYPMIEMWDTSFANQNPDIKEKGQGGFGWTRMKRMRWDNSPSLFPRQTDDTA